MVFDHEVSARGGARYATVVQEPQTPASLRSRQTSWTLPVPLAAKPAAVSVPAGPQEVSAFWIHAMLAAADCEQVMVLGLPLSACEVDELPKRTVRLCGWPSTRPDGSGQEKP